MKHGTAIEWTHLPGYRGETWNPHGGCTKVSEGCQNCFALRQACRFQRLPQYEGTVKDGNWTGQISSAPDPQFYKPLGWRDPRAIFVCSMSDFFHPSADEWREHYWHTIYDTPHHLHLILTKRPERIPDCLPDFGKKEWPWPHVWLGTSVENQEAADKRVPELLRVPAAKRFLSLEPLLGPVDLSKWIGYNTVYENTKRENSLQGSRDGRASNRRSGADLESGQANRGARENGNDNAPLREGACGKSAPAGIPPNQSDVRQEKAPRRSTSAGMDTFQRRDSSGHDRESQERDEARQPSEQFRDNDLLGANEARLPNGIEGRTRGEEPQQQAEQCSDRGNSSGVCIRTENAGGAFDSVRGGISDDIKNRPGGASPQAGGRDRGLHGQEKSQQHTSGRKGPISLIIVGGESGPGARPMHPDWPRGVRDQCQAAGVPFFFKQWGGWCPGHSKEEGAFVLQNGETLNPFSWNGGDWVNDPRVHIWDMAQDFSQADASFRFHKKRAGRLLDGREWTEFPKEK